MKYFVDFYKNIKDCDNGIIVFQGYEDYGISMSNAKELVNFINDCVNDKTLDDKEKADSYYKNYAFIFRKITGTDGNEAILKIDEICTLEYRLGDAIDEKKIED